MNTKIYIDEAGRGPLAGPLYVGLVYFPKKIRLFPLCKDSKKLSEKQRDLAFDEIQKLQEQKKVYYAIGTASAQEIDDRGMTKALNQAIQRGLKQLALSSPFELIIDGNRDFGLQKDLNIKVTTIIDGDALLPEIGMASIIAKVSRDLEMKHLAKKYPLYNFAKHKGYGTLEHRNLIILHGPSPIHRKRFLKKILPNQ